MEKIKTRIQELKEQLKNAQSNSEAQSILRELVDSQRQLIEQLETSQKAVADANVHISELYMELEDAQDLIIQQKNEILQQNEELNASVDQLTMLNDHLNELNELNDSLKKEQINSQAVKKSHKALVSSINYSQRIQANLLPKPENIQKCYKGFFAFYQPKDIVSGDYYWFQQAHHYNILVSADCTGHGVSGAFMTLIGFNLLDKLVCQWGIYNPSDLMHEMNIELRKALKQTSGEDVRDSMEMTIMIDYKQRNEVHIASAKRPFIRFRGEEQTILKGDKYPVGDAFYPIKPYSTHTLDRKKGDRYYFFSDGITDQFGGERNSKLTMRGFVNKLSSMQGQPMSLQQFNLQQFFKEWKGKNKQLDDVMVLGLEL